MSKTLKILGLQLELQRKMDFQAKKRDRSYKEKKAMIGQKKGMMHRKRAWRSKKRAWRSAMLKGPRGNTMLIIIKNYIYNKLPIYVSLLFFGLSGVSAVFPVIRVFPVNLDTVDLK